MKIIFLSIIVVIQFNIIYSLSFIPFRLPFLPKLSNIPSIKLPDFSFWNGNGLLGPPNDDFSSTKNGENDDKFHIFHSFQNSTANFIENLNTTDFQQRWQEFQRKFSYNSISRLWEKKTEGRSGLIILLFPSLLAQFMVLQKALPLVIRRSLQYIPSEVLALSLGMSTITGKRIINSLVWTSIFSGIGFMFYDSLVAGPAWSELTPSEDSYALVTGASSGLGKSLSSELYAIGYNLILISRKKEDLETLKDTLRQQSTSTSRNNQSDKNKKQLEKTSSSRQSSPRRKKEQQIVLINCDLSVFPSNEAIVHMLEERGLKNHIDILINNVGVAERSDFVYQNITNIQTIMNTNIQSAVALTYHLLPQMINRRTGRILFVSSVAGYGSSSKVALYGATKAFLNSFATSLRRELLPYGIFVTLATPGAFLSNFASRSHAEDGLVFRAPGCYSTSQRVAHKICQSVLRGDETVTPHIFPKLTVFLSKLLPVAFYDKCQEIAWSPAPRWIPFLRNTKALPSKQSTTTTSRSVSKPEETWKKSSSKTKDSTSTTTFSDTTSNNDNDTLATNHTSRLTENVPKKINPFTRVPSTASSSSSDTSNNNNTTTWWDRPIINYRIITNFFDSFKNLSQNLQKLKASTNVPPIEIQNNDMLEVDEEVEVGSYSATSTSNYDLSNSTSKENTVTNITATNNNNDTLINNNNNNNKNNVMNEDSNILTSHHPNSSTAIRDFTHPNNNKHENAVDININNATSAAASSSPDYKNNNQNNNQNNNNNNSSNQSNQITDSTKEKLKFDDKESETNLQKNDSSNVKPDTIIYNWDLFDLPERHHNNNNDNNDDDDDNNPSDEDDDDDNNNDADIENEIRLFDSTRMLHL